MHLCGRNLCASSSRSIKAHMIRGKSLRDRVISHSPSLFVQLILSSQDGGSAAGWFLFPTLSLIFRSQWWRSSKWILPHDSGPCKGRKWIKRDSINGYWRQSSGRKSKSTAGSKNIGLRRRWYFSTCRLLILAGNRFLYRCTDACWWGTLSQWYRLSYGIVAQGHNAELSLRLDSQQRKRIEVKREADSLIVIEFLIKYHFD